MATYDYCKNKYANIDKLHSLICDTSIEVDKRDDNIRTLIEECIINDMSMTHGRGYDNVTDFARVIIELAVCLVIDEPKYLYEFINNNTSYHSDTNEEHLCLSADLPIDYLEKFIVRRITFDELLDAIFEEYYDQYYWCYE